MITLNLSPDGAKLLAELLADAAIDQGDSRVAQLALYTLDTLSAAGVGNAAELCREQITALAQVTA